MRCTTGVIAMIVVILTVTVGAIGWMFIEGSLKPQAIVSESTQSFIKKPLTPSDQQKTAQSVPIDDTENWQTYHNEKYGIEFKYPDHLHFEDSETGNSTGILNTISANYSDTTDNHFIFHINSKMGGESGSDEGIDRSIGLGENMYIKKEIISPGGKIILTDGIGTANNYFMQAYYKGHVYNYTFEVSSSSYSDEMRDVFEKMMTTAIFTK